MKSLESTHEQSEASEQVPLENMPSRLPRRLTSGAVPAGGGESTPSNASALFGGAVNSGIHALQCKGGGNLDGDHAHQVAASGFAGGGAALPHADAIQRSFGKHDVGGVRAHVGGAASQAAHALGAIGYAAGDSVAFARSPDLHLAAHEAAHVVQQRGGVRLAGGIGASGDEYERHADEVADLVVRGASAESALDRYAHRGSAGGRAVQLQLGDPPAHRAPHGRTTPHGDAAPHGRAAPSDHAAPETGAGASGRPAGDGRAAGHIVQEPNPAQILDQVRQALSIIARAQGAEFPTAAFNALQRQLQTLLAQHRAGPLELQETIVSAGMLRYRFTLWGSITQGEPTDVREQRGTGTMTTGSQDQTGDGGTAHATDGSTDTLTASGTSGAEGGSASGTHVDSHSREATTTGSDAQQSTEGTSMRGQLEHVEYVSEVSVAIGGRCDIVEEGLGFVSRRLGLESAIATEFTIGPQVIGETAASQQHAAHSSARPPAPAPTPRATRAHSE